jgi:glucose/arabinose dehydrogenase
MRKWSLLLASLALLIIPLAGCNDNTITGGFDSTPAGPPPQLALSDFIPAGLGLVARVGFEIAPNDPLGRIFIVEQGGRIRIFQNGQLLSVPFLDVSFEDGFDSGGEKGLLGLAFHPDFASNGLFYVHYTRMVGALLQRQSVIAQYEAEPPANNTVLLSTEELVLVVDQPNFDNHKGGQLAFGPDGLLYIALGDGGGGGDNAQDRNSLLGKILRIGVNPFFIPIDNPFVGVPNTRPEIWALGLRNPWRFSFDRTTGRLFAGDVGQSAREEIDLITKGGNFGWNIMEGSICFDPPVNCNMTGLILPIADYDHSAAGGTSVIGGFVYRGTEIPALVGTYVFGDLSSGHVWGLKQDSSGNWVRTEILNHNRIVSAFGQDAAGELYMVDYGNGAILRLVAATPAP